MAASTGTMKLTIPIVAKIGKTEIHLGDAEFVVKVSAGRPKVPNAREIKAAVRKGLR